MGIFASVELGARIEREECRLLRAVAAAAARRQPQPEVFVAGIAGGIAVHTIAGAPVNKLAGLGFDGPVDGAELAGIEDRFAARGAPLHVELASLADPSVAELLCGRGYFLRGFENVLGRPLPAPPLAGAAGAPAAGITITASPLAEIDTWFDTVVTGFLTPDDQGVPPAESHPRELLERVVADFGRVEGFIRYLVRRDGEIAGSGSLRIGEGIAQLCGASTLPAHRRRGIQSALLARRLADAAAAGCDLAVVTTQPGSKSQQNAQRQGFDLLYTRAVLVRPPRAS